MTEDTPAGHPSPCNFSAAPPSQQQQANVYCVGIDLGSSSSVVACASPSNPQSVSIEVNRLANRATPSAVAFDGITRAVGEEAESRQFSLVGGCLQNLAGWLSIRSLADAEAFFNRFSFLLKPQVEETPQGLAIVIPCADGETKRLPITLAIGHFVKTLISFAEAGRSSGLSAARTNLQGARKPAALTIALPCSHVEAATEQLLLAAAATGVHEGVTVSVLTRAAALVNCWCARHLPGAFLDLQQQEQLPEAQQLHIGIVDVGFAECVVQIFRLEKNGDDEIHPTVLAVEYNGNLGVAEAITVVAEDVAAEVKRLYRQDVQKHSKKSARLFAAASLSATIAAALKQCDLSPDAVVAVDVVGGGSRIPWVAAVVNKAFSGEEQQEEQQQEQQEQQQEQQQQEQQQKKKLRRTLDGASSVAMGAASFAAGLTFVSPVIDAEEILRNIQGELLKTLQEDDSKLGAIEAAEVRRLEKRNILEAYLLEIQAAARGPQGAPLNKPHIKEMLKQKEHWLLDNDCATADAYGEALQQVKDTLEKDCSEYFAAVEAERQQKDRELESHAAAAGGADAKEDMDVKLPNSQCIKRAKKNKDEANELFKDGNTELAVQRYVKGLQYLAKVFDLSPQEKEETEAIRLSLHLNLAQAYLRLTGQNPKAPQYEAFAKKALASCDAALEQDPQCVKAMYRRAVANERLKEYTVAMADVKKALKLLPEDADFLKLKDRLEARIKAEKEQQKKVYSRMFG
ncbi:uncharacterized protein LOC34619834 [Cyclospora cayetanensis]|uniref:Uncharacterized protein LOC34619834 n=1 Tax=Cyclospora cayetanensis TaxID=88456 RepID=A0A6P6RZN9_9EIME|nr:uncharacterized protein LOC34619834 [Cyclospora cayetanensis]